MPGPVENLMAFAITTFIAVLLFAVIAGFLVGVVASLQIPAVAWLTRLVITDPPEGETE